MASIISAGTTSGTSLNLSGDTSGVLQLASNGSTTAVTIDTSQNVGIGTSPAATNKLQVSSAGTTRLYVENTANAVGVRLQTLSNAGLLQTDTNHPLTFATNNGAEAMRIATSGNLLVGTTAAISSGFTTISYVGTALNGLIISESANTSDTSFLGFNNGATNIGSVSRVGATSAVVYSTTSDQRLKSNIADANPVLDKLMDVKVRQFDWTEGNLHQDAGFIAQELAPVLSGIVTQGKTEEDMWQLDYSRLTPYLVKAVQELKAELDATKAEVQALKGVA